MKKIFLLVALIATVSTQLLLAQYTKSTALNPLLASYYDIKVDQIKQCRCCYPCRRVFKSG